MAGLYSGQTWGILEVGREWTIQQGEFRPWTRVPSKVRGPHKDFPWGEGCVPGRGWAKEASGSSHSPAWLPRIQDGNVSIPSRFVLRRPLLSRWTGLAASHPALMLRGQRQRTGSSSEESGGQTQLLWQQSHRPSRRWSPGEKADSRPAPGAAVRIPGEIMAGKVVGAHGGHGGTC